jgi:hypothetical protein
MGRLYSYFLIFGFQRSRVKRLLKPKYGKYLGCYRSTKRPNNEAVQPNNEALSSLSSTLHLYVSPTKQ